MLCGHDARTGTVFFFTDEGNIERRSVSVASLQHADLEAFIDQFERHVGIVSSFINDAGQALYHSAVTFADIAGH